MEMGKELSDHGWGLEIAIFLEIMECHKSFQWLIPLAVIFFTIQVISGVNKWEKESMESGDMVPAWICLEFVYQGKSSGAIAFRNGELVYRIGKLNRQKNGQGQLMKCVRIDIIGTLI
jgi:hypothetical protein